MRSTAVSSGKGAAPFIAGVAGLVVILCCPEPGWARECADGAAASPASEPQALWTLAAAEVGGSTAPHRARIPIPLMLFSLPLVFNPSSLHPPRFFTHIISPTHYKDEDFWANVARYISYFFSVMLGSVYVLLKPVADAFRSPGSAIGAVVGVTAALFAVYTVVNAMLGLSPYEYDPQSNGLFKL